MQKFGIGDLVKAVNDDLIEKDNSDETDDMGGSNEEDEHHEPGGVDVEEVVYVEEGVGDQVLQKVLGVTLNHFYVLSILLFMNNVLYWPVATLYCRLVNFF